MSDKTYQWNARDYAEHSSEQLRWAEQLIAKMRLRGNEALLDIGCGDGKVSAHLASCLPEGSVFAVDSSQEMTDLAARRYPRASFPNLSFQKQDVRTLAFENRFDTVFSNAAIHWVRDHTAFLPKIRTSLKPSGKLFFQMGGRGNAEDVLSVLDEITEKEKWKPYFRDFEFSYGFYGPEEYEKWLSQAGFRPERLELLPKNMEHSGRKGLIGWIRSTWLPYTEPIPPDARESFIEEIADTYLGIHPPDNEGFVHIRMMRLEVEAGR